MCLLYTGFLSEIGTKLRDWAVGQAGGSCYSQAALSSNDSKTRYVRSISLQKTAGKSRNHEDTFLAELCRNSPSITCNSQLGFGIWHWCTSETPVKSFHRCTGEIWFHRCTNFCQILVISTHDGGILVSWWQTRTEDALNAQIRMVLRFYRAKGAILKWQYFQSEGQLALFHAIWMDWLLYNGVRSFGSDV